MNGRHVPIRIYAGGLFLILTLAIGLSMAGLFYSRAKSAVATASGILFDRTATLVAQDVAAERSQISVSLGFAADSELATAKTLETRLRSVHTLHEVLVANPWLVAAYAGYPDGDFLLLRRLPPKAEASFGAIPPHTIFVLQNVERSQGTAVGRYVFFDANMKRLGEKIDPAYRYDPRTRPWYAVQTGTILVTAPYVFFTTRQLGITLSRRSHSGTTFGVDIDLTSVSQDLAQNLPTPGSLAAIVEPNGQILAYSDPARLAHLNIGNRPPTLADVQSPALTESFQRSRDGSPKAEGTYRDAAGREWLYRVTPVLGRPGSSARSLILAVPEDEMLGAANRVRDEALLLSLGLILLWIPLTFWLSRFISKPLATLRDDAVALRNLDFTEHGRRESIITEIAEFSDTFQAMRQHIRDHNEAATRFIPHEFLDQLGRDNILSLELGDHVERKMTILFSDIRSFTALSESMSPQQTFNFVNSYLTRVGPIIREHDGFIDKYIGDAIMGLFPNRPGEAVKASIAMQKRVVVYNEERARAGYAPIAIGIGLHYGDLMLGTIGETLRFETTVIADAVNIASRLESLTKTFGAQILASGQVVDAIDASACCLRRLVDVQVKGASRPITLYEVCDADAAPALAHKVRTAAAFEAGRLAYAAGEFSKAERLFAEILADDGHDRAAEYFRDRSATMAHALGIAEWDGVERMESK